jgi:hypothetical protein
MRLPDVSAQYIALSRDRRKPQRGEDVPQVDRQFAHALPTFHCEDPDLALIVGLWEGLPRNANVA